jgi:hypothetical protein
MEEIQDDRREESREEISRELLILDSAKANTLDN